MSNKSARTITEQINLLKSRGMIFKNEEKAVNTLKNISYYRLKGYWWDMHADKTIHTFKNNTIFEDVLDRYNFDRQLRFPDENADAWKLLPT